MNLNNTEYLTVYLLPEKQFYQEVNSTIQFLNLYESNRIVSALGYINTTILSNYFVSSLNTNLIFFIRYAENNYTIHPVTTMLCKIAYNDTLAIHCKSCGRDDPISETGFFSTSNNLNHLAHLEWSLPQFNTTLIKGFFAGCTPFQALLHSTLDCLYDIECIHLLVQYFPSLNQVCIYIYINSAR